MTGHRMRTDSLAKDLGSLVTDFAVSQVSRRPIYEQERNWVLSYVSWYRIPSCRE